MQSEKVTKWVFELLAHLISEQFCHTEEEKKNNFNLWSNFSSEFTFVTFGNLYYDLSRFEVAILRSLLEWVKSQWKNNLVPKFSLGQSTQKRPTGSLKRPQGVKFETFDS